jgi:hypothetical protein
MQALQPRHDCHARHGIAKPVLRTACCLEAVLLSGQAHQKGHKGSIGGGEDRELSLAAQRLEHRL